MGHLYNKNSISSTQAFTLVELSIVLVIIGLIVSGVLFGQTLIKQAKLRSLFSQMQELTVSSVTFEGKYGQKMGDIDFATSLWPNDSKYAGFSTTDGDNDGIIEVISPNSGEHRRAWKHLALAEIISYVIINPPVNNQPGVDTPESPFDGVGYWARTTSQCSGGNTFVIGEWDPSDNRMDNVFLDSVSTYFLDKKYDDGIGNSGIIRGQSSPCYGGGGVYDKDDDNTAQCWIYYCFEP